MGCTATTVVCTQVCYFQGETLGPYDCGTTSEISPNPCCPDPCTQEVPFGPAQVHSQSVNFTCLFGGGIAGGILSMPGTRTKTEFTRSFYCKPISPPPPGCPTTSSSPPPPPPGDCEGAGG